MQLTGLTAGRVSESASQQVSKSAERPWSDASAAFYGQKACFSGDFQRLNLTMRENFGYAFFERY
jgi:hypothetical protein